MAHRYPQQTFAVYTHPQWPADVKDSYADDPEATLGGDHPYDPNAPQSMPHPSGSRRHSAVKVEEEFGAPQMWHDRPHPQMLQMRHYSASTVPGITTHTEQMVRMHSQSYAPTYGPAPTWTMSGQSESSTPTPMYAATQEPIAVQFNSMHGAFPFQQEPPSAVAMSPQSSQGGWASATSTDSGEHRKLPGSPQAREMSPNMVMRPDGFRKKNARFEIPKEINLQNIEARIQSAKDDKEKKELKQQKRLLRNRQAALDSRQRKKQHTDSLEQDKKMWQVHEKDLKDQVTHLENIINHEREQMMQQRQQYETYVQSLTYERDEAIRTKTIETAELRRQNNVLKDCVRDLERQQATRGYASSHTPTDAFGSDFSNFGNLDLGDDQWDDEFSLINSDDLKMDGEDTPQRQLTPRPLPPTQDMAVATSTSNKADVSLGVNAFYMFLLFGAFIATQTNTAGPKEATSSSTTGAGSSSQSAVSSLPTLPDDYLREAGNVIKAVLSNSDDVAADVASGPDAAYSMLLSQTPSQPHSSLDILSATLTTPSRQQEAIAAFSLTPTQYEHITNPEGMLDTPPSSLSSDTIPPQHLNHQQKPTPLQAMFAAVQEERDQVDRLTGLGDKVRERSVLLDRVSPKVLRDFRALVAETQAKQAGL